MKEELYICTKCLTVQMKSEMMQRKKRVGKLSLEQSRLWKECKNEKCRSVKFWVGG